MNRIAFVTGIVALTSVAGCGGEPPPANVIAIVETGNADVMVPESNVLDDAEGNLGEAQFVTALNLAPDGLSLVDTETGSTRHINFGIARDRAVPMVTRALGKASDQGVNQECGAGPLGHIGFPHGLTMLFQGDSFVGWSVDGREGEGMGTANGVAIGATLRELRAAGAVSVEESTLGDEFVTGGIGGLIDGDGPDAKVTDLWAGTTCMFR